MISTTNTIYCGQYDIGSNVVSERHTLKLFKIKLSDFSDQLPKLENILSTNEIERSKRYHFGKDKQRFIICRGILKHIMAKHLGLEVNDIILAKDHNKKPFLLSHPNFFFNVSHAENYAVIAIDINTIGIDIECTDKDFDYMTIVPSVFSKSEIDVINTTKTQKLTFYKFWTRKEAIVKATGKGIDDNFKDIPSIDGFHSVNSKLINNINNLKVCTFNIDENYMGSVAYINDDINFEYLSFSPLPYF